VKEDNRREAMRKQTQHGTHGTATEEEMETRNDKKRGTMSHECRETR